MKQGLTSSEQSAMVEHYAPAGFVEQDLAKGYSQGVSCPDVVLNSGTPARTDNT